MSNSPIRIGILGTGNMAVTHGRNLAAMPGVSVVAVCSRSLDRAGEYARKINQPDAQPFCDFDQMLSRQPLDALCVCLPPAAHRGEAVRAASKGIHLLLEKPIALNETDAAAVADAVSRAGIISQVCYQSRFRTSVQRLARYIAEGKAGRPTQFTGRFWVNMEGPAWWRDVSQSGGQVFEQLIHVFNLATSMLGQPVSVTGMLANLVHRDRPNYTIEDTSLSTIRFDSGAIACISGSNCAARMHFFNDFRVAFENVTLEYRSTGQPWVTPDEAVWFEQDRVERIEESTDVLRAVAEDFVDAIRSGRPARCPASEAAADIGLITRVRESALNGGVPVTVVQ